MIEPLATAGAGILACVFLLAAEGKMRSPQELRAALDALGWLPRPLIGVASVGLPVTEALCAILLLVPVTRAWAGGASAALLATFTAIALATVVHGKAVNCGCFGSDASLPMSWLTVVRNALLTMVALVTALAAGPAGNAEVPALLLGLGIGVAVVIEEQWRANVGSHWVQG